MSTQTIIRDHGTWLEGPITASGPLGPQDYPAQIISAEYNPATQYRRGPDLRIEDGEGIVEYTVVNKPVWRVLPPLKAQAHGTLIAALQAVETAATGEVTDGERASYGIKEQAARAYLDGAATEDQTAVLQSEAEVTGESLDDLAQAILFKAAQFRPLATKVAGIRRAYGNVPEGAIGQAQDQDAVQAGLEAGLAAVEKLKASLAAPEGDAAA